MIPGPLSRYALGSAERTAREQTRLTCRRAADLLAFCTMRLLVCVSHLCQQRIALGPQYGCVTLGDGVDRLVVDLRVLVHEPIAEPDDEARVGDARSERRVTAREYAYGLADDSELALD